MHQEGSTNALGKGPASTLMVKQFVSKKDINTQLRQEEDARSLRTPEDEGSAMDLEEES